ncbi:30S ribosomal protein S21 [bacterium]|nr:30S ribosomal protein S21 [bacterium]
MPYIKVRDGEPFEKAFKRFTKSCEKAGLMAEIRKHQRYEKPSEARKRKSNIARRKMRKLQAALNHRR